MQQIGSKWWKFDFHTHTPASMDYGKSDHELKNTILPRQWLMDYINKGIECIAITDHNSGEWVDKIKEEADKLRGEGYEIHIFPGVEITSHGNIHILGIFDPIKTTSHVSLVIGDTGYKGTVGDSDAVTERSPQQVIEVIIGREGVAIPAHIDKPSGLCLVHKSGSTLQQILSKASAVEIIKTHSEYEAQQENSSPLKGYEDLKTNLISVLGSDSHHPNTVGRAFTWVKMCTPSIEGLRLALLDGSDSIKRSDQHPDSPNVYAKNRISKIRVNKTKYCGRLNAFELNLHPWLNCIIGGRGSGKSSLLEFARTCLERDHELSQLAYNPEPHDAYKRLAKVPVSKEDDGVFTNETEIEISYVKDKIEYILKWSVKENSTKIYRVEGEDLILEDGNILSRFPVKIFSQKQIYEISRSPNYLLKIIDESDIVNYSEWQRDFNQEVSKITNNRREIRDLHININLKSSFSGQLNDVNQKITSIEKSSHAQLFQNYNRAIANESLIQQYIGTIKTTIDDLHQKISNIKIESFPKEKLDRTNKNESGLIEQIEVLENEFTSVISNTSDWISYGKSKVTELETWFRTSELSNTIQHDKNQYNSLVESLKLMGISNPNEYDALIRQRKEITEKLQKISQDEESVKNLRAKSSEIYANLVKLRKDLTQRRRLFLSSINLDDNFIKINFDFCCDNQFIENSFRDTIAKNDRTFSNDIYNDDESGILNVLHKKIVELKDDPDKVIEIIQEFKKPFFDKKTKEVLGVNLSKRFDDYKNTLSDDIIDHLISWFPSDSVTVKYSDGRKFKDISQGSAGQKAATVLAFLLSYGNDPLILDQPEDDLDNQLIYELIVKRIKECKKDRQILIVTHNPNIVVNGDSELVITLTQRSGLTHLASIGGLQERSVRHSICDIMEGGRDAFQQRYRRIINI